jgi:hypothetical protein
MTLALHGKSRQRQATLVVAALLGIALAVTTALLAMVPTSATGNPNLDCSDLGLTRLAKYNYDGTHPNGTYQFESGTGTDIITWNGGSTPHSALSVTWDSGSVQISKIIVKSGNHPEDVINAAGATSGTITSVFENQNQQLQDISHIEFCGGGGGSTPDPESGTIYIKKVTVNDPGTTGFTADITTNGSVGAATDRPFSVGSPYTHPVTGHAATDDFTVTEDAPGTNWAVTGKIVLSGANASCPAAGSGDWVTTSPSSADVPNLASTNVTVCFRNEYTPPIITIFIPTPTPSPTPSPSPAPTLEPTPEPTPIDEVLGEVTPGPTPAAPSAGTGMAAGGSPMNMMLALLGLLTITAGGALMAAGRKSRS